CGARGWGDFNKLQSTVGSKTSNQKSPPYPPPRRRQAHLVAHRWLFYAVLVDLGDAVADEISLPFDCISLEMIYRGLYYFHSASTRGEASDPVKYFANPDIQKWLGIVKRQRKPKQKLIIAPFPEKQRGSAQFFFQYSPKSSLTSCLQA
ncbi:MAG: hypothetical protein QNJ65_07370, partial [Xenococcaceae cyanobacterium MO_234.B1]|nr:hypothetical protein [Xenococcaceae cyanobacterium MO_234.B1]